MEFKPYNYQTYCINRIIADDKLALFLDMGLGKTAITLTAVNELCCNRFEVSQVLVIAPKRVAESTWAAEAQKWDETKHLRVSVVLGSKKKRLEALAKPAQIYVINRENVVWLVEHYKSKWPFDMVVIDEMSSFKNHQAKRFKALTWVRPYMNRVIGLTGTPAPNGLIDLWAQMYLLDQGARLGKRITNYRQQYFYPGASNGHIVYEYKEKQGAEEAIQEAISDICVSMKSEDYIDLPQCVVVDTPVQLDPKSLKAYRTLEQSMLLEFNEETIDAGSAAALSSKLLQLCNGAVYTEENGDRRTVVVHDAKLEMLAELVESLNGQHALVFYEFRHDIDRIRQALKGLAARIELLNDKTMADWNKGDVDILLAHPASCAYGLNLQQGGHHVIWFGLNWSLELYQQANKRLHRQGQKERVIVHRLLVNGSLDEDVAKALEGKKDTQEAILDALKARIRKAKAQ